jgi:hypothetical protein
MKKYPRIIVFLALLTIVLTACGRVESSANQDTAKIDVKIETKPDPAVVGDVELILTITDLDGKPIEDARVDVSVDHIDMSGMTMDGPASEQGDGKFAIKADFSMSGNWEITVYVRKGDLDESLKLPLIIK